jgi:hypothetical protein
MDCVPEAPSGAGPRALARRGATQPHKRPGAAVTARRMTREQRLPVRDQRTGENVTTEADDLGEIVQTIDERDWLYRLPAVCASWRKRPHPPEATCWAWHGSWAIGYVAPLTARRNGFTVSANSTGWSR